MLLYSWQKQNNGVSLPLKENNRKCFVDETVLAIHVGQRLAWVSKHDRIPNYGRCNRILSRFARISPVSEKREVMSIACFSQTIFLPESKFIITILYFSSFFLSTLPLCYHQATLQVGTTKSLKTIVVWSWGEGGGFQSRRKRCWRVQIHCCVVTTQSRRRSFNQNTSCP